MRHLLTWKQPSFGCGYLPTLGMGPTRLTPPQVYSRSNVSILVRMVRSQRKLLPSENVHLLNTSGWPRVLLLFSLFVSTSHRFVTISDPYAVGRAWAVSLIWYFMKVLTRFNEGFNKVPGWRSNPF